MLQKVFLGVRIPPPPNKIGLTFVRPDFILYYYKKQPRFV